MQLHSDLRRQGTTLRPKSRSRFLGIGALIGFALAWTSVSAQEDLRFSNTMTWNPEFLAFTEKSPQLLPDDWQNSIRLDPPPANRSAETATELEALFQLTPQREPEKQKILEERDVALFILGGVRYGDLVNASKFPACKSLLDSVYHDLGVVVFTLKKEFDRVRPSFLAPELELLIPNPRHPAYPSGHSTCAHVLALVFADLGIASGDLLWKDAGQIAFRREIAGVHYASDSLAGQKLARQIYAALQQSPEYQKRMSPARAEWKAQKLR